MFLKPPFINALASKSGACLPTFAIIMDTSFCIVCFASSVSCLGMPIGPLEGLTHDSCSSIKNLLSLKNLCPYSFCHSSAEFIRFAQYFLCYLPFTYDWILHLFESVPLHISIWESAPVSSLPALITTAYGFLYTLTSSFNAL